VHGALRSVSEFSSIAPKERPIAICPICDRQVIMKLGDIRVHHYAHYPNDVCTSVRPETALHLNTKFYIYDQLKSASRIYFDQKCSGNCGKTKRYAWLWDWDYVKVEISLGSMRPDISIIKNDRIVGAIEVLVTHSVDDRKANEFREQGIRWVEVEASESLYEGKGKWTPECHFPNSHYHPAPKAWICEKCMIERERRRKKQEYEMHNYDRIHSAKMIDYYFPSGKKLRTAYYIMERIRNDVVSAVYLKTDRNEIMLLMKSPTNDEVINAMHEAVKKEKKQCKIKTGAVVDDFMEWRNWVPGKRFVARDIFNFPFRCTWDEKTKKWYLTNTKNRMKQQNTKLETQNTGNGFYCADYVLGFSLHKKNSNEKE
jgi:competence CoiA-like predicted nuclease